MLIDDPIDAAVAVIDALAARHCPDTLARGQDCLWYHGTWPYLRALGLGVSAAVHGQAMLAGLRELAGRGGFARVLVCGTADYALPALVQAAYTSAGQSVACTVLDICATPLQLCRWYAARAGAAPALVASDILAFERAQAFDLIVTHSLLGYFDPKRRALLARRWFNLLRPDGRALLIHRLRPAHGTAPVRFSDAQAADLLASARARNRGADGRCRFEPLRLERGIAQYAARMSMHPIESADALSAPFLQAGFAVDELAPVAADLPAEGPGGPSVLGRAAHVRLLLRKPS